MAITYLSRAWNEERAETATEVLVLIALSDYADESGWAYPRVKTLMRRTRLAERTVRQALYNLRDKGVIQIWERYIENTQIGSIYCLSGIGGDDKSPPDFNGKLVRQGVAADARPLAADAIPPAPDAGRMNPSVESVIKDEQPPVAAKAETAPPSLSGISAKQVSSDEDDKPAKKTPALHLFLAGFYNRTDISSDGKKLLRHLTKRFDSDSEYAEWIKRKVTTTVRQTNEQTGKPPRAITVYTLISGAWEEEWQKRSAPTPPAANPDGPTFNDIDDEIGALRFLS